MNQPVNAGSPKASRPIASILIIIAVASVLLFAVFQVIKQNIVSVDNAKTGDCLQFDESKKSDQYTLADCDSSESRYKVFAVIKNANEDNCIEVPGTSQTISNKEGVVCMGDKNVNVSKTINNIKKGECIVTRGDTAHKAACSQPGSSPVLAVLKDKAKLSMTSVCEKAGVSGAVKTYSWSLTQTGAMSIGDLGWDRVLCLGTGA